MTSPLTLCFMTVPNVAMASYRFRVGYVADALIDLGDQVYEWDLSEQNGPLECPVLVDALVTTKHWHAEKQMRLAQTAKAQGVFVIFDVCDDHFSDTHNPAVMVHYIRMANLADLILCSTPLLAERIKAATQKEAVVIPEPLEFDEPAKPRVTMPRRLLWHGHSSNLGGLLDIIPQIRDYRLHVITNGVNDEEDAARLSEFLQHPDGIYESWSLEAVRDGHAACDLVIVPIQRGQKDYKGHQRGVEALMLGRMAICSAIPAYDYWPVWRAQDNRAFGFLIDGYAEHVKRDPNTILGQIRRGQQQAQQQLGRAVIGKMWHKAISTALERRRAA